MPPTLPGKDDPKRILVKPGKAFTLGGGQYAGDNEEVEVGTNPGQCPVELARHACNMGWAVSDRDPEFKNRDPQMPAPPPEGDKGKGKEEKK